MKTEDEILHLIINELPCKMASIELITGSLRGSLIMKKLSVKHPRRVWNLKDNYREMYISIELSSDDGSIVWFHEEEI